MAEVLVRYTAPVTGEDGNTYRPQACGAPAKNGLWEGWLEFVSDTAPPTRSSRETTQPNRDALMYWAQGLSATYIEGALNRTLRPTPVPVAVHEPTVPSTFSGPANGRTGATGPLVRPVLNPFTTYAEGEQMLRQQLAALSRDQVVNIVRGYQIDTAVPYEKLTQVALIDAIVTAVKRYTP